MCGCALKLSSAASPACSTISRKARHRARGATFQVEGDLGSCLRATLGPQLIEADKHNVYQVIRNPVTSRWSSTPALPTDPTILHTSVRSTWTLGPENCRAARSLRKCPNPASPTGCGVTGTAVSGAQWVGVIRTRTACAATRRTAICSARSTSRKPSPICASAVSNETLHLRLDLALPERARRDEAVRADT